MIEYLYRPVRTRGGKRVRSDLWSGRYSLVPGGKPRNVSLHVTDKAAAAAKLRQIVVEAERERAGIIAPRAQRDAAAAPLSELVSAYLVDLAARATEGHATESGARIRRIVEGAKWARIADVTPSAWVAYRATLQRSAKTVKEYQTSLMAFLNWLVRVELIPVNPLAKVQPVKTRGKAVRKSRAFTQAEFAALVSVAPWHRRIVYLFLGYTGARKNEARSLLWSDLNLGHSPSVTFREERTKSAVKRVVPLKAELAAALRDMLQTHGEVVRDAAGRTPLLVFPLFPSDDALHGDLKRAGVARKDGAGRVVHFHAFRKTFQTWGAVAGVGQRSAQEMLGHSDPSLTAGVYTDVAALALHDEVAKLPWIGGGADALGASQSRTKTHDVGRFRELLGELVALAQVVVSEGDGRKKAGSEEPAKVAARHGFEP